tara:strand:+ start:5949 stop:6497 length:549 start_codon:yes stop_codon:yes gene_type:complete
MPRTKSTKSSKKKTTTTTSSTKTKVTHTASTDEPVPIAEEFSLLVATITSLKSQLTQLSQKVKTLERRAKKEVKMAVKNSKTKSKSGSKKKTGFTAPAPITDELAEFLGKEPGTQMARTEVTKELSKYFKKHNLQKPENRRIILANKAVKKLLRLKNGDELSYFNLQRYISPHFPKKKAQSQ